MQIDGPRDSVLSKGICQETRFDQYGIFSNSRFTISPLRGWVHLFLPKLRLDKPNATARLMERCKSSEGCHSWSLNIRLLECGLILVSVTKRSDGKNHESPVFWKRRRGPWFHVLYIHFLSEFEEKAAHADTPLLVAPFGASPI